MRHIVTSFLCLALLLTLTACSGTSGPAAGSEGADAPSALEASPYGEENFGSAFGLSTEWPAYKTTTRQIVILAENFTDKQVEFGAPYEVEVQEGTVWRRVPLKKNYGWAEVGISLPAHGTAADSFLLNSFDWDFPEGAYRIIVQIEGQPYAAQFSIKEGSAISESTPYGFASLEDLSWEYSAEQAATDGCMVFAPGLDIRNADRMDTFLTKVSMGIPTQLRLAQYNGEGIPQMLDVIYEEVGGIGRYLSQRDASRDGESGCTCVGNGEIFSFLVTDGWGIYLSNSLYREGDRDTQILVGEDAAPWIAPVQALTDTALADNVTEYRIWNGDAWAGLTGDTDEFIYGYPDSGRLVMLKDVETPEGYLQPDEISALAEILWIPAVGEAETGKALPLEPSKPEMLLLISEETDDGFHWYGIFCPETEKLVFQTVAREFAMDRTALALKFT